MQLKYAMSAEVWEGVFLQMLYSVRELSSISKSYPTDKGPWFIFQNYVIYSKMAKRLATPNRYARILEAKRIQPTADGNPQGNPEPRLLVSVDNFTRLMSPSIRTDNLEPMMVWVPEAFLPTSLIEELNPQNLGDSKVGFIDLTDDD